MLSICIILQETVLRLVSQSSALLQCEVWLSSLSTEAEFETEDTNGFRLQEQCELMRRGAEGANGIDPGPEMYERQRELLNLLTRSGAPQCAQWVSVIAMCRCCMSRSSQGGIKRNNPASSMMQAKCQQLLSINEAVKTLLLLSRQIKQQIQLSSQNDFTSARLSSETISSIYRVRHSILYFITWAYLLSK